VGEDTYDYAGNSVSGAGDVDADGRADLLIGADGNSEGGSGASDIYGAAAGAAYLIYGGGL
jgi:hypothetical protein